MRSCQRLILIWMFAVCGAALAQTRGGWERVQHITADQPIRIRTVHHIAVCNFTSADEDTLICTRHHLRFFVPTHTRLVFSRTEVESVKLSRQLGSTALGTVMGVGAGAAIGAGIDASAKNQVEEGHLFTVLMGLLGGIAGTGIGQHTDFLAGPVVYQMP